MHDGDPLEAVQARFPVRFLSYRKAPFMSKMTRDIFSLPGDTYSSSNLIRHVSDLFLCVLIVFFQRSLPLLHPMGRMSIQSDPLHVVILQVAGFFSILSITRPQQLDPSGDAAGNFFVGHDIHRLEGAVSRL